MPVIITKGGEDIPNNTYGFEIEFCSHDNSVFAFTHVDTGELRITYLAPNQVEPQIASWKIETDSGNVLELVSPPLHFPQIDQAYVFKDMLANALTGSVGHACTYAQWHVHNGPMLEALFGRYYGPCNVNFVGAGFDQVQPQINVENVDDGINIQAALVRLNQNALRWEDYAGETVLARSEKDWLQGYSSQVNLPMTVEGYFLYSLQRKLPKSQWRFGVIVERPDDLSEISVEKLERYLVTWYWRNIEFTVFAYYATQIFGPDVLEDLHGLLPDDNDRAPFISELPHLRVREEDLKVSRATYEEMISMMPAIYNARRRECRPHRLKELAILYVTIGKMLTGALGSLSERNQLALQEVAWALGSTEGMNPPIVETNEIMAQRRWLEYHSSLKDLTGLWFKAALRDVIAKENLCVVLPENGPNVWFAAIGTYMSIMSADRWDEGRIDAEGLDDIHAQELSVRIAEVEAQYRNYLAGLNGVIPPFNLPPRSERPFLHYGEWPDSEWEGRYDTMAEAIPPRENVGYTYLIEHRFN